MSYSPFPGHYRCGMCKKDKPKSDFYRNNQVRCPSDVFAGRCKECNLKYSRKTAPVRRAKLKLQVMQGYSGIPAKCYCCGETEIKFLTIDHMNGKGIKHRKSIGGGEMFYKWIIANNFPPGLRVACYNCNCYKPNDGPCPHEVARRVAQAAD